MGLIRPAAAAAAAATAFYSVQAAYDSYNGGSCYEYNIDYTGYDILTLSGVDSPSLCQDACEQTNDCYFFSWSALHKICYLKSIKAVEGRQEAADIVSGPKTCVFDNDCFSEGVDYVGFDLHRIEDQNIPSPKACQDLCLLNPRCAFFSYKINTKGCYLKHAGALVGRSLDSDVISGPRKCEIKERKDINNNNNNDNNNINDNNNKLNENNKNYAPALPGHYCAEGSVEYKGRDVEIKKNIRSASHCQQLCFINNKCFYWTWDKNKFICNLKGADANNYKAAGRHTLGKVSGNKDCLPINTGCHHLDTSFLGSVLRQIKKSITFDSCQLNCQNDDNCEYFTWSVHTQLCQLRADAPFGFIKDSSTKGMVAGPKFCPNDDVCIEQADYAGYDLEAIEDGSVFSAIECRSICRKTEGCAFFTWNQKTNNCYLKTEEAILGKRNALTTLGRFSGPRFCNMFYGCLEPNTAYLSSTATRSRSVSSFSECEALCKSNSNCTRWTYLAEARTCLLLTAADRAEKVQYDGALSAAVVCNEGEKKKNEHKCLFPGVKYKDAPMNHIMHASGTDDCHFECKSKAQCKVYTFENGTGCLLYDKPLSDLTPFPSSFPVAISGVPDCTEGKVGAESGAFKDTCYTKSEIEGGFFYAYNAAECADACLGVPGCMYWTYDYKKRADSCILFKKGAVPEKCTSGVSGEKGKQAETYDTFRYDAQGAVVDGVTTLEKCREECNQQGYAYWNYFPEKKQCVLLEDGTYVRVRDFFAACGTAENPLDIFNQLLLP